MLLEVQPRTNTPIVSTIERIWQRWHILDHSYIRRGRYILYLCSVKPKPTLKYIFLVSLTLPILSCKREKKDASDELGHSFVTTLEVRLILRGDTIYGRYKDPDGPGGRPATVDTLRPNADSTYTFILRVLDESGNPIKDITDIIFTQQKNTHRMFFFTEPTQLASIQPTDTDDLGRPVGGKGIWTQGPASVSSGKVRFILRHYSTPGDKTYGLERGSTDLDVELPIRIRN